MFTNRNDNAINHQNMLRRQFYPALERAGLRRTRFHSLRHSYATLMISNGENMKFIQNQMGHASIRVTMDLYGHILPEVSQGVGERLDQLVFSEKVVSFPLEVVENRSKTTSERKTEDQAVLLGIP